MSMLLIHDHPLMVLPKLAVAIGLNEAIVLQQIHYWTLKVQPADDGHVWVYNSVEQWREQFPFWSADTIARTLKSLRDRGVVVAEKRARNVFDKTLYYRIDREVLDSLDTRNLQVSKPQTTDGAPQGASADTRNLPGSGAATCQHLYTETTQKTTKQRNPPKPPKGGDGGPFDLFWSHYPKKVNKPKALQAFQKLNPDAELMADLLDAIRAQKQSEQWTKDGGQFIPHAATWLNNQRWLDEVTPASRKHAGFDSKNYREGVSDDGSF